MQNKLIQNSNISRVQFIGYSALKCIIARSCEGQFELNFSILPLSTRYELT